MCIEETTQAFEKWKTTHPRNEDYDMDGLQIYQYEKLFKLADKETFINLLYNLLNYPHTIKRRNKKVAHQRLKIK